MNRPSEKTQTDALKLLADRGWSAKEVYRCWLLAWGHEAPRDANTEELRLLYQVVIRVQGEA